MTMSERDHTQDGIDHALALATLAAENTDEQTKDANLAAYMSTLGRVEMKHTIAVFPHLLGAIIAAWMQDREQLGLIEHALSPAEFIRTTATFWAVDKEWNL